MTLRAQARVGAALRQKWRLDAGPLNAANGVGWGVGLAGVASGVALVIVGGKTPTAITPGPLTGGGGLWMTKAF